MYTNSHDHDQCFEGAKCTYPTHQTGPHPTPGYHQYKLHPFVVFGMLVIELMCPVSER